MTDHDLLTLLRADVAATEPHHAPDPMGPVRLGRRRLRARRLRATAGATAVVAAVAVAVPLGLAARDEPSPATSPQERVREVLEPSTGPLGEASVQRTGSGEAIGFGDLHAMYRVTSGAVALDDPAGHCRTALARGYVSCVVEAGAVVQVQAVVPVGSTEAPLGSLQEVFARVPVDGLADVDPADRFFRREVLVGTGSAWEQVDAASPGAAAFVVPVADLRELAEGVARSH